MARNNKDMIEENSEQRDEDQAQDIGDAAAELRLGGSEGTGHDPIIESEHGGSPNPAAIIPEDAPDLVDTMKQMLTSGIIDNSAYAGEPMMDDEEEIYGQTDNGHAEEL